MIKVGDRQVAIALNQDLLNALGALEARKQRFSQMAKQMFDCLEISYEEMLGGTNGNAESIAVRTIDNILDFLNVEDKAPTLRTKAKKANTSQIQDLIANHEEVIPFFEKNGLRQYTA